jgi:chemotaxis protein MotD
MIDQTTISLASAQKHVPGHHGAKGDADQKKAAKGFADLVLATRNAEAQAKAALKGADEKADANARQMSVPSEARIELSAKIRQSARHADGEAGLVADRANSHSRTATTKVAKDDGEAGESGNPPGRVRATGDEDTRTNIAETGRRARHAIDGDDDTKSGMHAGDAGKDAVVVDPDGTAGDAEKLDVRRKRNDDAAAESDNAASQALEQLQKIEQDRKADEAGADSKDLPADVGEPGPEQLAGDDQSPTVEVVADGVTDGDLPVADAPASLSEELTRLLGLAVTKVGNPAEDTVASARAAGKKIKDESDAAVSAQDAAARTSARHHHVPSASNSQTRDLDDNAPLGSRLDKTEINETIRADKTSGKEPGIDTSANSDTSGDADSVATRSGVRQSGSDANDRPATGDAGQPGRDATAAESKAGSQVAGQAAGNGNTLSDSDVAASTPTSTGRILPAVGEVAPETMRIDVDKDALDTLKAAKPRDRADADIRIGNTDKTETSSAVDPRARAAATEDKTDRVVADLQKTRRDDASAASASSRTDFIMVLESRRYLGFSSDSNASALTAAIKSDPTWTNALRDQAIDGPGTATEVNTLKLKMNPEHLGGITASLRLKGDELSVDVRVETVEAYRQMSTDQEGILRALKDQGFSIDQVSVQLAPAARNDNGQDAGSQPNNGQNLREGQGDNGRQRDDNARRAATQQDNWTTHEQTSSSGDSDGSAASGTRNLYL